MAKLISGTKDLKTAKVVGGGDARKVRCNKCSNLAVATPDGKGGVTYICPNCLTEYKFSTMD
jgi:hypothetical protein